MKSYITMLFLFFNFFVLSQPSNGLIAYYTFDGDYQDQSGNNNVGAGYNTIFVSDRFNINGKSIFFNGINSYVSIPNSISLNAPAVTNKISISLWFFLEQSFDIHNPFLTKSNESSGIVSYALNYCYCSGIGGNLIDLFIGGTSNNLFYSFNLQQWYHLVVTYNEQKIKYYVNSVLVGEIPFVGNILSNDLPLELGRNVPGTTEYYHGRLDDVRIYSRDLAQAEIFDLYQENGWPLNQGLIAYYPFNGNANDESGNGNNGNIIGGVNGTTDRFGNLNSAMQFNGIDGYIEVPNSPSLQSPINTITIAGWIYIDAFPGIEVAGIVEKTNSNSIYGQYALSYHAWSDDVLIFWHSNGIQGTHAPVTLDFLRWYFVAITYDGTTAITYLDGVPIYSQNVSGPIVADDNPLTIGLEAPGQTEYLQGKLDDIRIYNRALSAEEISDLYHENGWTGRELNTIIITHGATFGALFTPITESQWRHFIWQFSIADAISPNREIYLIRKSKVYKIFADYLTFENISTNQYYQSIDDIINQIGTDQFTIDSTKDNIFIFDWTLESGVSGFGYLEAAADVLASTLVNLANQYQFILENLHFIGHSRGTVVNSEAIQRLLFWEEKGYISKINKIHMTTLDAHAAGDNWISELKKMDDNRVNSSNIKSLNKRTGITGWKNSSKKVNYMDNYYQQLDLLKGRNYIPGIYSSSNIANIDVGLRFSSSNSAHQMVHSWYYGTVDTIRSQDNFGLGVVIDRNNWYPNGQVEGFFNSINRSGNLSQIESLENELFLVSEDWTYGINDLIFNGDFSKSIRDSIPGYSFQGGHSSKISFLGVLNGNFGAELNYSKPILTHNQFYFPPTIEFIWFRIMTLSPSNNSELKVYIANELLKSFQLNNYSQNFRWEKVTIPDIYKGKANTIKFELSGSNTDSTKVMIDDIGFYHNRRINSSVACPVNFHIYDHYGNLTGSINDSVIVEEIPGSQFFIYEDSLGNKIKTVSLPPLDNTNEYNFIIESQDTTGHFTYTIEDYSDTSLSIITYIFANIPIEPNTVATCSLNNSTQIPILNVDINGDGNPDTTITPVIITSAERSDFNYTYYPSYYKLEQNYPNPFNPITNISYYLPVDAFVTIKLFDITGQVIAELVNEHKAAGSYNLIFNASKMASGVYFYEMRANDFRDIKKLTILK